MSIALTCFHCGEACSAHHWTINEKPFCCAGCKSVYALLHRHEMDDYYCLNAAPGVKLADVAPEKFSFLDDETISQKLLSFYNEEQARITFYLPQIHCSSCIWLLEHLRQLNEGVITSRIDFFRKEITVSYFSQQTSLREIAELLTSIGYEPHISMQSADDKAEERAGYSSKKAAYKVGIAGFCFANIMLISFPEYLGMNFQENEQLVVFFRAINLLLALPTLLYSASEFFVNAFYSFRQRYLNIDAPIALAISVTFIRSLYEILTGSGAGYLDSMSGIIFFMLLGRTLQNRTYSTLQFNRDYKSYFPIAVTLIENGKKNITPIQDIKESNVLCLHHQEVVPTDSILSKGIADIDYSFITGENELQHVVAGGLIYAGGKITGKSIEVIAVNDFRQDTFTRLWNNQVFDNLHSDRDERVTTISRYFSIIVLILALFAFTYWQLVNPAHSWNALTAVLIVACPCALLLNATFTNGYLISYLAKHGLFLKNAAVIEAMSKINHIAFDKTGTITEAAHNALSVLWSKLSKQEREEVVFMCSQSLHPLSRAIVEHYGLTEQGFKMEQFQEVSGQGIAATIEGRQFKIGSSVFVGGDNNVGTETEVFISIDGSLMAHFQFKNKVKKGVRQLIKRLNAYRLSLISGDNNNSQSQMSKLFNQRVILKYRQSPEQKLAYIKAIQAGGEKVMMVGDGLNDAGALKQSDVGIAVVQQSFSFSPACDAILEATKIQHLPDFIAMAKASQRVIIFGFCYSLLFNIIGISFAVTAHLSPMIAAILMPLSSLGIMLITYIGVRVITYRHAKSSQ